MIMRPPQQGHGGRWSAAALAARSASSCSVDGSITCTGAAISSRARDVCLAGGAGEQSVVADAVETLWQNVEQEAPDAFAGRERHRAKPLPAVAAVNPCGGRLRRAGRGRPAGYSIGNIEARCAAVSVACRSMVTCSARAERFEQCFRISFSGRRRLTVVDLLRECLAGERRRLCAKIDAYPAGELSSAQVRKPSRTAGRWGSLLLPCRHDLAPWRINVAGPVEIVRDGDLLAASLAQRHRSSAAPRLGQLHGQFSLLPFTIG
jgi:hypothetical protein